MDQKEQKEKIIGLARLIVKASEIYGECLLNSDNLMLKPILNAINSSNPKLSPQFHPM